MKRNYTSLLIGKQEINYNEKNNSISIKLVGGFGRLSKDLINIKGENSKSLQDVLDFLENRFGLDLRGYGSSFIVLINDVESSILGGLEVKISPRDEIVILRISHGG